MAAGFADTAEKKIDNRADDDDDVNVEDEGEEHNIEDEVMDMR